MQIITEPTSDCWKRFSPKSKFLVQSWHKPSAWHIQPYLESFCVYKGNWFANVWMQFGLCTQWCCIIFVSEDQATPHQEGSTQINISRTEWILIKNLSHHLWNTKRHPCHLLLENTGVETDKMLPWSPNESTLTFQHQRIQFSGPWKHAHLMPFFCRNHTKQQWKNRTAERMWGSTTSWNSIQWSQQGLHCGLYTFASLLYTYTGLESKTESFTGLWTLTGSILLVIKQEIRHLPVL